VAPVVAAEIVGFCWLLVKLFGPVQEYETPPELLRLRSLPSQIGLLLPEEGVGNPFTVTVTLAHVELPQLLDSQRA
jgi:hypothetical protein